MKKKLYKSSTDKKISGVCAGIANYFGIDPTVIRVAYLLLSLCTTAFPGLLVYIVLAVALPEDNGMVDVEAKSEDSENE